MTKVAVICADQTSEEELKRVIANTILGVGAVPTPVEYCGHGAVVSTEKTGGMGVEPDRLVVNTLASSWTFTNPRLVSCGNLFTVVSALSSQDSSGTLQTIRKYYIVIDHHVAD